MEDLLRKASLTARALAVSGCDKGTEVRIFSRFEASYIDVGGDGVFALCNPDQPYKALAVAVTLIGVALPFFESDAVIY